MNDKYVFTWNWWKSIWIDVFVIQIIKKLRNLLFFECAFCTTFLTILLTKTQKVKQVERVQVKDVCEKKLLFLDTLSLKSKFSNFE